MTTDIKGIQNLQAAAEWRAVLLDALRPEADVVLDVEQVSGADFAFLQVIEAARRQAERVGASLSLDAPARGALLEALTEAGFLHPADRPDAASGLTERKFMTASILRI